MANELYSLLEVSPEATADTLRRAYFKALRKHPPDTSPEQHQQIRDAWNLLSDPEARREYDALQKDAGELSRFMEKGAAAMESRDWQEAVRTYKAALALDTGYRAARWQLARALCGAGDAPAALPHYDRLCRDDPANLRLHAERGFSLLNYLIRETQNEPARLTPRHLPFLDRIVESFERCRSIDPRDCTGAMGLGRLAYFREDWEKARYWGRQAAAAQGESGFEAFEPLFMLVELSVLARDYGGIPELAQRIEKITPPQPELRTYVGWQFGRIGMMVLRAKDFGLAQQLLEIGQRFAPEDEALQKMANANRNLAATQRELEQFSKDSRVIEPVRALAVWAFLSFTESFPSEQASKDAAARALTLVDEAVPLEVLRSLEHLREQYPRVYTCQDAIFDELRKRLARERRAPATSPQTPLQSAGCGCLMAAMMVGSLSGGLLYWWA